jgi:hypothetical protein
MCDRLKCSNRFVSKKILSLPATPDTKSFSCRTEAQSENDKGVLGIHSGLNRVIPLVEHLDQRTNKASKQNQRNNYLRGLGSHGANYSTGGPPSHLDD